MRRSCPQPTDTVPAAKYPTLATALRNRWVWVEDGTYVGRAADGVWVQIGCCPAGTESYLAAHPTPSDW